MATGQLRKQLPHMHNLGQSTTMVLREEARQCEGRDHTPRSRPRASSPGRKHSTAQPTSESRASLWKEQKWMRSWAHLPFLLVQSEVTEVPCPPILQTANPRIPRHTPPHSEPHTNRSPLPLPRSCICPLLLPTPCAGEGQHSLALAHEPPDLCHQPMVRGHLSNLTPGQACSRYSLPPTPHLGHITH